jgi:hypothetical protein
MGVYGASKVAGVYGRGGTGVVAKGKETGIYATGKNAVVAQGIDTGISATAFGANGSGTGVKADGGFAGIEAKGQYAGIEATGQLGPGGIFASGYYEGAPIAQIHIEPLEMELTDALVQFDPVVFDSGRDFKLSRSGKAGDLLVTLKKTGERRNSNGGR